MYNQPNYGGCNYPNQYNGGYYTANGDYYNNGGGYYENLPPDRYYTYGQQPQAGYNYGKGYQSNGCMDECLACMAAMCCCCLVCDMLNWFLY